MNPKAVPKAKWKGKEMIRRLSLLICQMLAWHALCECTTSIAQANDPKLLYILVDVSDSTTTEARNSYAEILKYILDEKTGDDRGGFINGSDRIVIEAIRDKSALRATYGIREVFPVFSPFTENRLKYLKTFQELRARVKTKSQALLGLKGIKTTEIMSALMPAQQIFDAYPEYSRKILLILSDMLEESPNYNFAKRPPQANDINRIIANEKKNGRLPRLAGVKVYIAGAAGPSTGHMQKVKAFWLSYFKACGAQLADCNYGAGLARFEK